MVGKNTFNSYFALGWVVTSSKCKCSCEVHLSLLMLSLNMCEYQKSLVVLDDRITRMAF